LRSLSYAALAVLLGVLVIADAGCMKCGSDIAGKVAEQAVEKAVEKGTGGKVDIDASGSVDISGLPEFCRYPGAKATAKWSMSGEEGTGTVYSLETADPKDKVVAWYKQSLEALGWKQSTMMETEDGTMLMYGNDAEKKVCTVTVSTEDGKTTLVVMYGQNK